MFLSMKDEFDEEAVEKFFRKKQTLSRYSQDYGYIKKTIKPPPNLFAYKKISELQYKHWLTKEAQKSMDQWLLMNDSDNQEIVNIFSSKIRLDVGRATKFEC